MRRKGKGRCGGRFRRGGLAAPFGGRIRKHRRGDGIFDFFKTMFGHATKMWNSNPIFRKGAENLANFGLNKGANYLKSKLDKSKNLISQKLNESLTPTAAPRAKGPIPMPRGGLGQGINYKLAAIGEGRHIGRKHFAKYLRRRGGDAPMINPGPLP